MFSKISFESVNIGVSLDSGVRDIHEEYALKNLFWVKQKLSKYGDWAHGLKKGGLSVKSS